MAKIEAPRRVGETLEVMGGQVPLRRSADGTWEVDLTNVPHGALAGLSAKHLWRPATAEYSVTAPGFAPLQRLGGIYEAHAWCERHWGTVRRWARRRFTRKEFKGRLVQLINEPQKLRHLVMDGLAHPGEKLDRIVKHIATEESLITSVAAKKGGGKSVTTAIILERAKREHGCNIAMLDTRPRSLLPKFVRRIVDLRAADQNEIIWIDEAADVFSHRKSMKKDGQDLPAIIARARHMGLTVMALAPTTGVMDKTFDVLADALLLKLGSMNQGSHGRGNESRIISQFPEMMPTQKEEGVFVSNLMPPTSFTLPYVCGLQHEHTWPCAIPSFWKPEFSKGQLGKEVLIHQSPDHQELAVELLYWDADLVKISETMMKRGCTMPPEQWGAWLYDACNGTHPRTGAPLDRFGVGGGRSYTPPEAQRARRQVARERKQTAAEEQRARLNDMQRRYEGGR